YCVFSLLFFFSSRRRHTRFSRDWSSDVCSSDLQASGMPKEAREKAKAELNKLKMMSPMSAEATVVRSYLDWMVNVPWKKRSKVRSEERRVGKECRSGWSACQ